MLASEDNGAIGAIIKRLRTLESNTRAEVAGGVVSVLFAALPTPGQPGRILYVSNGRKVGEGAGAGTGTMAYDDGNDWIHFATDTPVQV